MITWDVPKDNLDPEFAADVEKLLGEDLSSWIVYFGYRSCEEQERLYQNYLNGGPLAAPPGESAHQCGLAVDVVLEIGGREIWDTTNPAWQRLWDMVKVHPRLHSGHEFPVETHGKVGPDDDHIQAVKWIQKREELKASGKWGKCG